jgi:hypothetical protein
MQADSSPYFILIINVFTNQTPMRMDTMATPKRDTNHLAFVAVPENATRAGVARLRSRRKYRCIVFSIRSQIPAINGVRMIKLKLGLTPLILNVLAISRLKKILYQIGWKLSK